MSLFKVRDWWSTVAGYEELHTAGSLALASVNVHENFTDCVFVGSYSGVLRGYRPCPGPYTPDHLLLETQLQLPILQLLMGRLLPNSSSKGLVVLHPKLLVVYSCKLEGEQLNLLSVVQFPLRRTAYNMALGAFGRVSGQDLVCVQSIDGQLEVFDHTGAIFGCGLSDFLLPGPLCYLPRTDSLLTINSGWRLDVYRYQSLRNIGGSQNKKATADWSLEIGEPVVDIKAVGGAEGAWFVLLHGERSVVCISESGAFVFYKKLESSVTHLLPYRVCDEGTASSVQYILSGQQLCVMKNVTMLWAAQIAHPPVAMAIANFKQLNGVIVTLDEAGYLQCSYLGTDPHSLTPSLAKLTNTRLSLPEMENELRELKSVISDLDNSGVKISNEGKLVISVEEYGEARSLEGDDSLDNDKQRCVEVKIRLSSSQPLATLSSINIAIDVAPPINVHSSTYNIPSVDHVGEVVMLTFVSSAILPCSRYITVTATYSSSNGHTHSIDHTLLLPIELYCTPHPPQDGHHKITLDSTQPCVDLSKLYPSNNEGRPPNALAFQLLYSPVVTIVASKTSNRYRIQSDSFSGLCLLLDDLVERLYNHHKLEQSFKLSFTGNLPLTDYFELIDNHHQVRVALKQCRELLGRHAHQFRAVQKRLLARFKDRTPTGLAHLDTLLDGTFMQLMALAEKNEDLVLQEDTSYRMVCCGSGLLVTLLRLLMDLSPENVAILYSALCPNIPPNMDQGWEELVDSAVTQLLRTTLARNIKDQGVTIPDLTTPPDTQRLKRHIALLCDRLGKGGQLTATQSLTNPSLPPPPELVEPPASQAQLPTLVEEDDGELD